MPFYLGGAGGRAPRRAIPLYSLTTSFMRTFFLLAFVVLLSQNVSGQNSKINNRNYYDFYYGPNSKAKLKGNGIRTNWLRTEEVIPVILDELQKAGYEWLSDNRLYHLDSSNYVILSAFSQKSNIGFIYVDGHAALPLLEHRQKRGIDLENGHFDYQQMATNSSGKTEPIRVKRLPDNVLMLSENWYWYQSTDNPSDDKYLLTKEDVMRVLRQDIRDKLGGVPKPIKD